MAKTKLKLAWLSNNLARKNTYNQRKKGLMKKAEELRTLCGVNVCTIIFSSYNREPDIWPSQGDAFLTVNKFKELPETEQYKNVVHQEDSLRSRVKKMEGEIHRQLTKNIKHRMTHLMSQALHGQGLHGVGRDDLNYLMVLIEEKMKDVKGRIDVLPENTTIPSGVGGGSGGDEKTDIALGVPLEALQRQQQSWNMNVMSPNDQMGYNGNQMDALYFNNALDDEAFSFLP
ncbi:hypothetical protein GIB67_033851 [Kingdonia uniflora]|uniref:MADS-box domain-containing protein n=1 Tax=Kingdonia uniflora TaxID=39325 RepID=A0A7J7LIS6_9MAGN|nr:hypothetical protein GIB67_033851 [Kingdonia uniflora]